MKRLIEIQNKLKVPKNQKNSFGNYKFRNCEDILEAVKPLLKEQNLAIVINDDILSLDGRFYVKATASLQDDTGKEIAKTTALARETEQRTKFDESQLTGAASSYARKYALNGLFAIDDTKDADTLNNGDDKAKPVEGKEKPNEPASAVDVVAMAVEMSEIKDVLELKRYKSKNKSIWDSELEVLYNERLKVLKGE